MTVVERIYREPEIPEAARHYARDTITLGWEDRAQAHAVRAHLVGTQLHIKDVPASQPPVLPLMIPRP